MKVIGIILIIIGVLGIICGFQMYGDIGVAAIIGAVGTLISGIGFILVNQKLNNLSE